MSNFEYGYCSPEEYFSGEQYRIREDSVSVSGLYLFFMALPKAARNFGAKFPARINETATSRQNVLQVDLTILNADLKPDYDVLGDFAEGIWLPGTPTAVNLDGHFAVSGYLRDYSEGDDPERALQDIISRHTAVTTA